MEASRQSKHPNESRQGAAEVAPQWLYRHGGEEKGPVPLSSLKDLAMAGQLAPADEVRRIGTDQWRRAGEVEDIFPRGDDRTTTTPPANAVHG